MIPSSIPLAIASLNTDIIFAVATLVLVNDI